MQPWGCAPGWYLSVWAPVPLQSSSSVGPPLQLYQPSSTASSLFGRSISYLCYPYPYSQFAWRVLDVCSPLARASVCAQLLSASLQAPPPPSVAAQTLAAFVASSLRAHAYCCSSRPFAWRYS
eukprot:4543427-Prymnesium_polylepis.1